MSVLVASSELWYALENRSGRPRKVWLGLEVKANAKVTGTELDYDHESGRPVALFDVAGRTRVERTLKAVEGLQRGTPLAALSAAKLSALAGLPSIDEADRKSARAALPARVKREVERYLQCGDVRYGFAEVTCQFCEESRLVAFSCKSRGWCPSCTTRRAIETGAHLESVLPRVAHRQWTLSLPFTSRFQVVKRPALLKRLEVRLVRAVWRWQRHEAKRLGADGLAIELGAPSPRQPQSDALTGTTGFSSGH